jgi:hypothetical protein
VTTPFCPEVFATEQEALAYGRTEELRQELMDRVRAMSFDELRERRHRLRALHFEGEIGPIEKSTLVIVAI